MTGGAADELASRLDDIAESIADLAIDELRAALRTGGGRPAGERKLSQARRAVEKAAHLLRSVDADADGGGDED